LFLHWAPEAIFALPSITLLQKQRFRVEGVHYGTHADAHPPRENAIFATKCWKVVQKSLPKTNPGPKDGAKMAQDVAKM